MRSATVSSENALAEEGLKRGKNDRVWDWTREVAHCVRNYLQAPAVVLPLTRDASLITHLAEQGKADALAELIRRLADDTQTYAQRFKRIYDKHSQRRGSSANPDDLIASIAISQEYMQYMASYESVVMTTLQEVLEIMEGAGLEVGSIKVLADGQLFYNLYSQAPSP